MNTWIALIFPAIASTMGRGAPFVFFAAMTALQFVVVLIAYPEAKGQTLEALQRRLVPAELNQQRERVAEARTICIHEPKLRANATEYTG